MNVNKPTRLSVGLNLTGLNPYIIRPVFNSYALGEISYLLKDAKIITVCDANKEFFQVLLHEDSKKLMNIFSPEGVYVYSVLAVSLLLASDVFEMTIRDIIKGFEWICKTSQMTY